MRTGTYFVDLVRRLVSLPRETEWLEFKHDDKEPQQIGEYISALSNAAALAERACAYLVWGVEDSTHQLLGTAFDPEAEKIGNEELENWLYRMLTPRINFDFHVVDVDGTRIVVLEIDVATSQPVAFHGVEYLRVGTYKKRLKDHAEKERALWRLFDRHRFEESVAAEHLSSADVVATIDYPAYFEYLKRPVPETRDGIVTALAADRMVVRGDAGGWNVTNVGALLFAKRLDEFPRLDRKAVRVIQYRGADRTETIKEQLGSRGYASGFAGLVTYVDALVPANEVIQKALRVQAPMYPTLAVRELVANALIHQDLTVTGAGPMIELFADRLEITNPGTPLVETERFLDTPPHSRNERLASLMRRFGMCEERGSGVDKVVSQTEVYQLPAPRFDVIGATTRATLFSHRDLIRMDRADRVRACYLHACLKYVSEDFLTNTSLRERFAIREQNSAHASRLIKEALEAGVIAPHDPNAGRKFMKYVPFWAKSI